MGLAAARRDHQVGARLGAHFARGCSVVLGCARSCSLLTWADGASRRPGSGEDNPYKREVLGSNPSAPTSRISVRLSAAPHYAKPTMTTSRWRTPRRRRGSATLASTPSNPGCPPAASPASTTRWPTAGSVRDDGGAGMVPRKRYGWRENRHDHLKGRARTLTRPSPACRHLPGHHKTTLPTPWGPRCLQGGA
jgi:hypothetical protein